MLHLGDVGHPLPLMVKSLWNRILNDKNPEDALPNNLRNMADKGVLPRVMFKTQNLIEFDQRPYHRLFDEGLHQGQFHFMCFSFISII